LITITSFCSDPAALRARRAVVITARVHPGESNASWVMKGMLDYLTGPSLDARILRDNFVFKIVPMLNPDGVIVGNYRCSLAGQDLNRLWDDPSRKMHPTIFFTKSMMRHLMNDRDVILYIDIHGHSRKKNVFMYGNSEGSSSKEKIFPGLLCRSSDCFCFDDCCFKIQKCKESTARVVAYRELSIANAFTLEASFCGADFGPLADYHFTIRHLEEMGYMICDAILDFCDPDQTKVLQVMRELQLLYPDDGASDDVSDSEDDGAAAARARRRKSGVGGGSGSKKAKREKATSKKKAKHASEKVVEGRSATAEGLATEAASAREGGGPRARGDVPRSAGRQSTRERRWRDTEDVQALRRVVGAAQEEAERWSGVGGASSSSAAVDPGGASACQGREREAGGVSSAQVRRARKKKRSTNGSKAVARGDAETALQDGQGGEGDPGGGGGASSSVAAAASSTRSQSGDLRLANVFPPLGNNNARPRRGAEVRGAT